MIESVTFGPLVFVVVVVIGKELLWCADNGKMNPHLGKATLEAVCCRWPSLHSRVSFALDFPQGERADENYNCGPELPRDFLTMLEVRESCLWMFVCRKYPMILNSEP